MQKPISRRQPAIYVGYSPEEFLRLKLAFKRSSCHTITGYVRKLSLGGPVEIVNRNASFDAFIEEIIPLRKEMAAIRSLEGLNPENRERLVALLQTIQEIMEKIANLCTPQ